MSNPYDNNPIYSADVMKILQDIESLKGLPDEDYVFEADYHFWKSAHDDTDEYMIKYGTSLTYYKYADGLPHPYYYADERDTRIYPIIIKPISGYSPIFYTYEVISNNIYLCEYTASGKNTTALASVETSQSSFQSRFPFFITGTTYFGYASTWNSPISPRIIWWTGGTTYHSIFEVYEVAEQPLQTDYFFRGYLHVERNISDNAWVDYNWITQLLTPQLEDSLPPTLDLRIHCSTQNLVLSYFKDATYQGAFCYDYVSRTVRWNKSLPGLAVETARYYVHSSNNLVSELKRNDSTTSTITKYYVSGGTSYRTGTIAESYLSTSKIISSGDSSYVYDGSLEAIYNFFTIGSSSVYSHRWGNWYLYLFNLKFYVYYWLAPDHGPFYYEQWSKYTLTSTDIADDDFLSKEMYDGGFYYIPVNTYLITQIQNVADSLVRTFHDWGHNPTDDVGSGYWGPLGTTFYQYYFPHSDYGLNTDPEVGDVQSDWYGLTDITYGINIGECAEMISAIKGMMEGNYYSL